MIPTFQGETLVYEQDGQEQVLNKGADFSPFRAVHSGLPLVSKPRSLLFRQAETAMCKRQASAPNMR